MLTELGRLLMWLGGAIFVVGLLLTLSRFLPGLGHLPGDVLIERANFKLYAPFGTMIVVSIVLTLVLNLLLRLLR